MTTTTSDDLVVQQDASVNGDESTGTVDPNTCKQVINGTTVQWGKIDDVSGGDLTRTLAYTDTNAAVINFTFIFNAEYTGATWSASAPFTGTILVKSANNPAQGSSFYTTNVTDATTGTITTPATNQNGIPQAISHVCLNGTAGTTTTGTTTTTTTTTGTTTTGTTTTGTTTGTTTTGTTTGTTTTGTTTGTVPVPGTTGGGGAQGGDTAGALSGGDGGLPFTGFQAPLMVLVALAMGGAGLLLRKRLDGTA